MNLYALPRTFVIAEVGINHEGDTAVATRLIREAHVAGADAVKFQTYITAQRTPIGSPIFDVLKKAELTYSQQRQLKRVADSEGIAFFSTPFDEDAVAFLAELGMPLMKVASFRIVDTKLLRAVAATGIPTIISRGMASKPEIDAALDIFRGTGTQHALLHCVSAYPTPKDQVNLRAIATLRSRYVCPVGYSDHTVDDDACVAAVVLGAEIIEKHFTLDRNAPGGDHALSADPAMMARMVDRIREAESMMGDGALGMQEIEKPASVHRRIT